MNNLYPYSSPIILTDAIYINYGGHTGTSVAGQRDAAYLIAEKAATTDIGSFLLPTTLTGTFSYADIMYKYPFMLPHCYVNSVNSVSFLDAEEASYWSVVGTNNVYVSLRDDTYGIVDLHYLFGNCNCHSGARPFPYQVQIVYNAGLPSGTSYQADILLALTTYADIVLNEIIGYGNEAPGDIGVQSFQNQDYSENRIKLLRTAFGSSARANFAHRLLTSLRKHRWVGI